MSQRWIIGLASGAAGDGVDAALLELRGLGLEARPGHVHGLHQPFEPELRELVLHVTRGAPCESRQVARLHRLLGETFAAAARAAADGASLSLQKVQCIGCSGHTAWHDHEGRFPSVLSLGLPAVIAERCGVTTVSDFRARDLAAGGLGVPLTALADLVLFRHPREDRCLVHLGGVSRLVYLPRSGRVPDVSGFEPGPCNALLDALMRHVTGGRESYDPGGRHAVQGRCLEPLLLSWMEHPYFQRRPPKGLPRSLFSEEFAAGAVAQVREHGGGLHDLLCTATHFVARAITTGLRRCFPGRPDRVLLSGGGVRNGLLWHLLAQQLEGLPLARTDEVGVPAALRKALSFAVLAGLTLDGVAGNVPTATGAAGSRLLGSLTPGSSSNWSRCLNWMAQQVAPPAPELV